MFTAESIILIITVMGCYCSGHFYKVIPAQHSNPGMCKSGYSSWQQGDEIRTPGDYALFVQYRWKLEDRGIVQVVEFVQDLGKRISGVTNEPLETQYLFQRMSMAVQKGRAIGFKSTFPADNFWGVKTKLIKIIKRESVGCFQPRNIASLLFYLSTNMQSIYIKLWKSKHGGHIKKAVQPPTLYATGLTKVTSIVKPLTPLG